MINQASNLDGIYSMIALLALMIIFIIYLRILRTKLNSEKELNSSIIECFNDSENTNLVINKIFKVISSVVNAKEYGFYLAESKNVQYALKSIHYNNDVNDSLNLSYSGLIPHKKAKFVFPLAINISDVDSQVKVMVDKNTKLLCIPISGGKAFIQLVVDFKFKLSKRNYNALKLIAQKLEPVVQNIILTEQLNNKIKILETAKQATRSITSIISGEGIWKMAISMFTKTIGAKGGFFLKQQEQFMELAVDAGFSKETLVMFKYDSELHSFFKDIVGDKKIVTLNKNDKNFSHIPSYLISDGFKQILLFKINYGDNVGIAGFWYDKAYEIDEYQIYSLLLMFSKISDVFENTSQISRGTRDNLETLKIISTLVDDLSPYTVGFSNLMQHYATIIAQEMKLNLKDVQDIALAAFLSNIGVAALSYEIFLKKGKYSEFDYEVIKLHSEIGADIIESLYGNIDTANMVRYHHERIDGCGYPHGLKGEEIPVGAKILAVTQFFVAKISPRNFRDASTYDDALAALKSVSNTQLDEEIVNVFVNYINKIRLEQKDNEGSIDHCWNMRFVSSEICSKCHAKMRTDKKCWESKSNLCVAHGNKCETCFIYTEFLGRKNLKAGNE